MSQISIVVASIVSLLAISPEPKSEYFAQYNGQIQGLQDTLVQLEAQFFRDEHYTQPLSKKHVRYVQIDEKGMFESGDLKFYAEPVGLEYYYARVAILGMKSERKWKVVRGCGRF
jgi:hypothetical protein